MTKTKSLTKKVRASTLLRGDEVAIEGRPVKVDRVTHENVFPGWPSQPYTQVIVHFAEGSGFAQGVYGWSEWVEVFR